MKKDNMGKLLGVALVVAIICTGLFYMLFAMKANSQSGTTLVVAAKALKAGMVLTPADLKTIAWLTVPADSSGGAIMTPQEIVGSTVFDAMAQDEPVLSARLATPQSGGGAGVPVGMRAVSIHLTDSTGVLGLLRGGQRVDVQVVMGHAGTKGEDNSGEVRTALGESGGVIGDAAAGAEFAGAEPSRGDAAGEACRRRRSGGGRFRRARAPVVAESARRSHPQPRFFVARHCDARRPKF